MKLVPLVLLIVLASVGWCGPLTITRVWPERITYKPGATATITVTIANGGTTNDTTKVALSIRYGLDNKDTLPAQAATVPAGKSAIVTFSYPIPADRKWGHEAVATLLDANDATLTTGHEYFAVGNNPWEIGHYITVFNLRGRKANGDIDNATLPGWRQRYITTFEGFSWQPSVFDGMAPKADVWRSGQGGYHEAKEDWQYLLKQAHTQGMAGITYIQCFSYGPAGMDFARRHPDWMTYGADGRPAGAWFDVDMLNDFREHPDTHDYGTPGGITVGSFLPTKQLVGDWWIDEVIKSIDMFGWDGFRSDGSPGVVGGYDITGKLIELKDPGAANTEFLKKVRRRITTRYPDFFFGWNQVAGGYPQMFNSAGEETVMLKDAYSLYEFFNSAAQPSSPYHEWKKMIFYLKQEAGAIRNGGGYPHVGWMPSLHFLEAFASACGAQVDTWSNPEPYRHFEFRWSEFLWDNALRYSTPDAQGVTVNAPPAIWWQEFVQARDLPGGNKRVIVHLINMPEKTDDAWADKLAPPVANVKITMKTPPGMKLARIAVLSPDAPGEVIPVTPAADGSITLPQVIRWSMVVAEFAK